MSDAISPSFSIPKVFNAFGIGSVACLYTYWFVYEKNGQHISGDFASSVSALSEYKALISIVIIFSVYSIGMFFVNFGSSMWFVLHGRKWSDTYLESLVAASNHSRDRVWNFFRESKSSLEFYWGLMGLCAPIVVTELILLLQDFTILQLSKLCVPMGVLGFCHVRARILLRELLLVLAGFTGEPPNSQNEGK